MENWKKIIKESFKEEDSPDPISLESALELIRQLRSEIKILTDKIDIMYKIMETQKEIIEKQKILINNLEK